MPIGPVERALRERLSDGVGLRREDLVRSKSGVGLVVFDQLVFKGLTERQPDGRHVLRQIKVDPHAAERKRREQEAIRERQRKYDEQVQAQQRLTAARVEAERRQRLLWMNTNQYGDAERKIVVAERTAALAESEALLTTKEGE